jgi:hypothetical protein
MRFCGTSQKKLSFFHIRKHTACHTPRSSQRLLRCPVRVADTPAVLSEPRVNPSDGPIDQELAKTVGTCFLTCSEFQLDLHVKGSCVRTLKRASFS